MLHRYRPPSARAVWFLVGAAVLVQIVYPLMPTAARTPVTMLSVVVFAAASLADAARVHGLRGVAALLAVACGGGLVVEAAGPAHRRAVRALRATRGRWAPRWRACR